MFSKIWNYFIKPTVDAVIADFNKVIARLESTALWHELEADAKAAEVKIAQEAADVYKTEAARARAIADKLKEIFS